MSSQYVKIHQNPFKIYQFHKIFTVSTLLAARSRWIYFHQKKVSEMKFSDKVDIKNVQNELVKSEEKRDEKVNLQQYAPKWLMARWKQ